MRGLAALPDSFHLPADGPLSDEDRFVDFWFMQPVAVFELLETTRLASMTDLWQRRLQLAIDRHFSWENRRDPVPSNP